MRITLKVLIAALGILTTGCLPMQEGYQASTAGVGKPTDDKGQAPGTPRDNNRETEFLPNINGQITALRTVDSLILVATTNSSQIRVYDKNTQGIQAVINIDSQVLDLTSVGHHIYALTTDGMVEKYDYTKNGNHSFLKDYYLGSIPGHTRTTQFALQANRLYVASGPNGLFQIDIEKDTIRNVYNPVGDVDAVIAVKNTHIYALLNTYIVEVIRADNPDNLVHYGGMHFSTCYDQVNNLYGPTAYADILVIDNKLIHYNKCSVSYLDLADAHRPVFNGKEKNILVDLSSGVLPDVTAVGNKAYHLVDPYTIFEVTFPEKTISRRLKLSEPVYAIETINNVLVGITERKVIKISK
jgi:hypothetical protein